MMNGYANPAAGQCRCQQGCVCQPGQPCRCSSGCTCSHASAAAQASLRTRNWVESGENEMRHRSSRGAWLRTRARNMLQQRLVRQDDWSRRSQLNGMFARRFNWGPQLEPVSRVIGSPYTNADSRRFMFALARWQQRQGLPVTGILSPSIWRRLLAILQSYPVGGMAGGWPQPQASEPPPQEPASVAGDAGAPPDDTALPLPGDAGEPEPAGNEFVPVGFRNRRNYARQAMGQI